MSVAALQSQHNSDQPGLRAGLFVAHLSDCCGCVTALGAFTQVGRNVADAGFFQLSVWNS